MDRNELWNVGLKAIKELEVDNGILASGREEIYGCVFGRDSLISALKLLRTYEKIGDPYFLSLTKKILKSLSGLQGEVSNIESGEEPGKIIHEFRKDRHEHLTKRAERPWYLYPDGTMRSFDSVDSTPLYLIALSRYLKLSNDEEFRKETGRSAEKALGWMLSNIQVHKLGFVSYTFSPERKFGGLPTQSWMDSADSIFHEDNAPTPYPIAPSEVQAYVYLALKLWGKEAEAKSLKARFNQYFVKKGRNFSVAFALDGEGRPMESLRSSIGHVLWGPHEFDSILESIFIPKLVKLIMSQELFDENGGIRTLSKNSRKYNPMSYHNGSIWPHDNAIIAEGLENFGYVREANRVRLSLRKAWEHFKSPIELFVFDESGFREYLSEEGQKACRTQAWSAASMLAEL